jgi:hypothetical protein
MFVRLRIELLSVQARDTEDTGLLGLGRADEFYLVGAVLTDAGEKQGVLTTPVSVAPGQVKGFLEPVLFEGELPERDMVALHLLAYDEDAAKDWSKRPEYLDTITRGIATRAGEVVVASLGSHPLGWGVISGAVGAGMALAAFHLIIGRDEDDQLGVLNELIPASGPPLEVRQWSFSHGKPGDYSSWDYTVEYRIRRWQPETATGS